MKFEYDKKHGRMVGVKTILLSKTEIEKLGGIVPSDRHVNPGTGYIPERDVMRVKTLASRYDVTVSKLGSPYDAGIGGFLYRFERTVKIS